MFLVHKGYSDTDLVVLDRPTREDALRLARAHTSVMVDLHYETCDQNNRVSELLNDDGEVYGYEFTTPNQVDIKYYITEVRPEEVLANA